MSNILTFLKRYQLAVYVVLVYGIAWFTWGSQIAAAKGWIGWQLPEIVAFFGVSLSAVALTALTGGRAAIKEFFSRFVRWRAGVQWYAVTLLLTAGLSLLAIGIHLVLGGTHQVGALVPVKMALPLFAMQVLTHILTEEPGWRGFVLPRLLARYSALSASLILGVIWAFWHLPLFFVPGSHQSYPFVGFAIQVIAGTIIMTWIYNHTDGSVLFAALFHAAMNTSLAVFNTLWGDLRVFWIYVGLITVVAIAIVVVEGPEHLARNPSRRERQVSMREQLAQG